MSVQLIDSKIIKETQESLGKIIKKPPMTDKLLSKPPFRFLHDIVIKTTGFMVGLFTDAEMNSDNVKEKDSKIAFLQKVIDIVSLVNDTTISVKPSKIIAGNDPEKTNELLQLLAKAINKKHSISKHKKRTRSGERDREKKSHKEQEETKDQDRAGHEKSRHKDKRKHKSENEAELTAPQDTKESSSTSQEMKVKDKKRHKSENITAENDKLNASDSSKNNNHGGKKRNKTDENERSEHRQKDISSDFIETPHKKDRDLMTKDIDKIQTLMQSSTRNINPLGKTLDFLQEDMDSMLKELNNWKEECKKHRQEFLSEQSISIASLEPLKSQLKEVNASIFQQLDLIATVKNNILENDKKISQILTSIIKN
ncbi:hypothetical protein HELRODRAFT_64267 [Helobdella robusta]|uniref:TRAF3-interacting protein 1 n=1 Tax=Helobdella robusta TaxID=6412 RepID=T1FXS0_HELRO|nr:hypothetical protein HELRODRAFT_64267 [Helobdella robusta]ESO06125.1 hypothetical protein HELRODRAFT_64267 [Helobdella robusta]